MEGKESLNSARDRIWIRGALIAGAALNFFIHWPLIVHDPITTRDDHLLIDPLLKISSLRDYFSALRDGAIFDVQPLRDLGFWLNIKASYFFGFGTFHLTNVFLWIACLAVSSRIVSREIGNARISAFIVLLLAIHPAMANSVAWISAEKHLWAALFALLATDILLSHPSSKQAPWKAAAMYFFSLLAQPIHIFIPLWFLLRGVLARQSAFVRAAAVCAPVSALFAAINIYYYRVIYTSIAPTSKFAQISLADSIGMPPLSVGRCLIQLAAPFWLSAEYYLGSKPNLVGLILLPIFAWVCIKRLGWRFAVIWLVFTFLPVTWLALARTNIFASDSYLLLSATGFAVLVGRLIEPWVARSAMSRRVFAAAGILIAVIFYWASARQSFTWRSDDSIFENIFRVEKTPHSEAYIGLRLLERQRYDEALELGKELIQWAPSDPATSIFYARAVYLSPRLSDDQKLDLLKQGRGVGKWPDYYASILSAKKRDFWRAYVLAQDSVQAGRGAFGKALESAVAETYSYCGHVRAAQICDEMVNQYRRSARNWSEPEFQRRLGEINQAEKAAMTSTNPKP
ncbi:MAG: hypothetical protein P4M08_11710 [Oligoflexia bacterium]|nr:hypothetical protein [Oligoflexia bacterium]